MVAVKIRPVIILLGDSLTEFAFGQVGWAHLLAQEYARRADVLNRGYQGYSSKMILQHALPDLFGETTSGRMEAESQTALHSDLEEDEISTTSTTATTDVPVLFWVVGLGANDAALSPSHQVAKISLNEFAENLEQIVSTIRSHENKANKMDQSCSNPNQDDNTESNSECTIIDNQAPIIFMTPPPCNVAQWRQVDPNDNHIPDNGNAIYKTYADQVQLIANNYSNQSCSMVDLWSLLGGNDDPETMNDNGYQVDGVHLSAQGNRVVFQGLMDVIRNDYPHLAPMTDGNGQFGKMGIPLQGKLWWMYN